MLLEKIKEINRAEQNAAEQRQSVRVKAKSLTAKANGDGVKLIAEKENEANEKVSRAMENVEKKAAAILERAKSDSKIEAVTKKVESDLNVNTAVKYVVEEILAEWRGQE